MVQAAAAYHVSVDHNLFGGVSGLRAWHFEPARASTSPSRQVQLCTVIPGHIPEASHFQARHAAAVAASEHQQVVYMTALYRVSFSADVRVREQRFTWLLAVLPQDAKGAPSLSRWTGARCQQQRQQHE